MYTDSFQTLFERLPIGAYRSSSAGHQLRANAALVKLNGYQTEAEMLAAIHDIGTEWYCDPQRREQFTRLLSEHGQVVDLSPKSTATRRESASGCVNTRTRCVMRRGACAILKVRCRKSQTNTSANAICTPVKAAFGQ
ncbi:PAS domain-containing protein [Simplicispira suum]|uniref:PAS domain-containing protein n=1 Tax=Simplicispira suum TaxID=2109915 RepID=UPI001474EE0C|nr:PAS domain-containing protein [Simplicispira suum]